MKLVIGSFGFLLVLSLGACAAPTDLDADSVSGSDELVSDAAFQQAANTVRKIDYLPFAYKEDGCYARSLYMAMELAATGRESNAIFAFAKPNHPLKVGSVEWGYHVAPMLYVGTSYATSRWMVLDPSISNNPLTSSDWVARMGYPARTAATLYPALATVPGAAYGPKDPDFNAWATARSNAPYTDVPNFAAMPAFKMTKIQLACETMNAYLKLEAAPNATAKRNKLLQRTGDLTRALEKRNKLDADATFDEKACAASTAQP